MYNVDLSLIVKSKEYVVCPDKCLITLQYLSDLLSVQYGLNASDYYILLNGKKINEHNLQNDCNSVGCTLRVIPRTFGGKGGFGSMLRAIGAQIEKTTNREACRDLSGRRLRDINEEQRLKNWIAQQADREREAAERKKKKLERLCQEPKHDFKDEEYDESRLTMAEKMSSSVEQGLKASTSVMITKGSTSNTTSKAGTSGSTGTKRKHGDDLIKSNKKPPKKKKRNLWIDAEESDSESSDSGKSESNVK